MRNHRHFDRSKNATWQVRWFVSFVLTLGASGASVVCAQVELDVPRAGALGEQPGVIDDLTDNFELQVQTNGQGGALLKTDPELESLLEKADRHRADGNYRIATRFWQAVLDRSEDALFSADDKIYFSLAQRVEQILSELPSEGLETYRVTADANAKAILNDVEDDFDIIALSQVVRRYFVSSLGDDAALQLSSIYLDRYDFVGAYRLLNKIVQHHPDPSISLADLHLKRALCEVFFGEREAALASIQRARLLDQGEITRLLDQVEAAVSDESIDVETAVATVWQSPLGNSKRLGLMPSLPTSAFAENMQAVWQYFFEPNNQLNWSDYKDAHVIMLDAQAAKDSVTNTERSMIGSWFSKSWTPAGHLVFDQDHVFFKTPVDLVAWKRSADSDRVAWRPVRRNAFELDDFSRLLLLYRKQWNRGQMRLSLKSDEPASTYNIQMFGDRIASQMSLHEGLLFSVEGTPFDITVQSRARPQTSHWNASPRRSRNNFLSAYDADSGRRLWELPRIDDQPVNVNTVPDPNAEMVESPYLQSGGFMAAPVGYRNLVIAPVNQGGTISLYAFDAQDDGKTVWSSYLCDEPESGAVPWSPINLSIDGSDLFVSCGLGVIFVVDPSTGLIRFAKRYQRHGTSHQLLRQYGRNQRHQKFDGWSSDTIIPYGKQMICFRSDSNNIESYSRANGQLLWRSDIKPLNHRVNYILGVIDGVVYTAGEETLIGYEIEGGRIVLGGRPLFEGNQSQGRGMLTPDGIYLPVGNKIYKFALRGKTDRPEILATATVELGSGAPLGNLFSDGKRIWVHGGNRLYALGPSKVE